MAASRLRDNYMDNDASWDLILDPQNAVGTDAALQLASIHVSEIGNCISFCSGVEIVRRTTLFIGFLISFLATAVSSKHETLNSSPLANWIRHHLRKMESQQDSGGQISPVPLNPITYPFPIADLQATGSCPDESSKELEVFYERLSWALVAESTNADADREHLLNQMVIRTLLCLFPFGMQRQEVYSEDR